MKKYFCVHGHFYQPPRENPWTGTVERQYSAHPEHDWNRRIARECYIPNTCARLLDSEGRIEQLVNNYAHISFNFGPTLLDWFEKTYPRDYRMLIEADQESCRRLEGHGNALAQAYNHMILPLANPRDLHTQIRWGLADFRRRFGRKAEAMWIPETACNDAVLQALIDHEMKFAILAPNQAARVRPIGAANWSDVSAGPPDPRRAYRWSAPGSHGKRQIAVFFYDAGLSHGVAFEKVMVDARAWAQRVTAAFDAQPSAPQLVSICTDGESYGHHEHFGEMGLCRLLTSELPGERVEVVNYAYYLAKHPPQWEVEIKPGADGLGTSWSCSHGVARWKDACGCGADGKQLAWRRPMRQALDWLSRHLAAVFEREGARLFKDPWRARDAYIDVILDRGEESTARFMAAELAVGDSPESRLKALQMLEMQRHALLMYTSCGWFFSDISGIEAVQNLQYAARAVELARRAAGVDLEGGLVARLAQAPSNYSEHGDGGKVYRKLALRGRVSQDLAAAHHGVSLLFSEAGQGWPIGNFQTVESAAQLSRGEAGSVAAGRAAMRDGVTGEVFSRIFLAANRPGFKIDAYVRPDEAPDAARALQERVKAWSGQGELDPEGWARGVFPSPPFGFEDLPADEGERILQIVMEGRRKHWTACAPDMLECLSLAEQHWRLGLEQPPGLRGRTEDAVEAWLRRRAKEFLDGDEGALSGLGDIVSRARRAGLAVPSRSTEDVWGGCFRRVVDDLERRFDAAGLRRLCALVGAAGEMGLQEWRFRTQNRFYRLLRQGAQDDVLLAGEVDEAARRLGISAEEGAAETVTASAG
ncbi:MAG: DUF3536 domain-containing protein [Elusimicrobia bacterium]|nr:DUF3536 domain-containing protein [Elusimicrobiota bacterium]